MRRALRRTVAGTLAVLGLALASGVTPTHAIAGIRWTMPSRTHVSHGTHWQ